MATRLVHFAGYSAPYASSFVFMVRAILRAGLARGWDSQFVLEEEARPHDWTKDVAADGIRVDFMPVGSRLALRKRIESLLAEDDGPVILHTHFTHFDVAAALAARGNPEAVMIWHLRTRLSPALGARLRNRARFALLGRRVDRIYCNAPDMAEEAIARGAPADRVEFVPNAIDLERFPAVTPEARREARAKLGLPQDLPVLLHFGWWWEIKGGDLFVRSVERLVRDGRRLVAVTAGGGEPAEQLREELGLGDSLVVLPFHEHVQELYAAADVFVACSRAEGMPNSLPEALASGLGAVASDLPGQRIQAPVAARKLVPLDPEAIAAAAGELLDRPREQVAADASSARAWLEENQGIERWAQKMLDRYDALLGARAHR